MSQDAGIGAFQFLMPTEVVFGSGALNDIGKRSRALGERPLIVTGRSSARVSGALDRVLGQLPNAVVYSEVQENPTTDTCDWGADICRANACDVVIAIGGGSPMDVAKAIAGLARNPGNCADYFGAEKFTAGALPIIAVPTTAGTGSEVTPYSIIIDPATRQKRSIAGKGLFPAMALLDPDLTLTLPRHITINAGLDVLSQAMEGFVSRRSTAPGDALALEACRLVVQWLPRAADDGTDLNARAAMLYAAMLAGCVIAQSGTTLVHGMGYYLTVECGVPHGLANALLLTPLFQHNALVEPEKVSALAAASGFPGTTIPQEVRERIGQAIHRLLLRLDVSPAAKDHAVDPARFRAWAEQIAADPYRSRNQPGTLSAERLRDVFTQAYVGTRVS